MKEMSKPSMGTSGKMEVPESSGCKYPGRSIPKAMKVMNAKMDMVAQKKALAYIKKETE